MFSFFLQLFWEKRLQSLYACDMNGEVFRSLDLPANIQGKTLIKMFLLSNFRELLMFFFVQLLS